MQGTVSEAANAKIFLIQLPALPIVSSVPFVKRGYNIPEMRIRGGMQKNYKKFGGMPKSGGEMENVRKGKIALREKKI